MSKPAPGALETVRSFLNTLDVEDGVDSLATPAELAAWLAEQGLTAEAADRAAPGPRPAAAPRAMELRGALRPLRLAHHAQPLPEGAAATLDATARRARLTVRF